MDFGAEGTSSAPSLPQGTPPASYTLESVYEDQQLIAASVLQTHLLRADETDKNIEIAITCSDCFREAIFQMTAAAAVKGYYTAPKVPATPAIRADLVKRLLIPILDATSPNWFTPVQSRSLSSLTSLLLDCTTRA